LFGHHFDFVQGKKLSFGILVTTHGLGAASRLTLLKGKRIFIKDIIHYLVPPNGKPATVAPSLQRIKRGVGTNGHSSAKVNGTKAMNGTSKAPYPFSTEGEPDNPTVVPADMLARFHFTFLIRDPHSSIPSYFRCTVPPLDEVTGFYEFYPSEAGYDEVRRVFDYLRKIGHVGPRLNGKTVDSGHSQVNGFNPDGVDVCVLDADDLLDDPAGLIEAYCKSVGITYEPEMLSWDSEEHQTYAKITFEKWKGFHEDAIHSKELKARTHVSVLFLLSRRNASLVARGFTKVFTHILIMTEEARQNRVRMGCGVEREVRCKSGQSHQGDRRQEYG
jgi:Sulfotransferase domain